MNNLAGIFQADRTLKDKKVLSIATPMTGSMIDLEDIPDPVFSTRMIGDGFAVKPESGEVVSPCSGRIVQIAPTRHAVGIETKEGIEVLIHVGIDTVDLKGEGFDLCVKEGDLVNVGTRLMTVDIAFLTSRGKSLITPVLIINMEKIYKLELEPLDTLSAGKTIAVHAILK